MSETLRLARPFEGSLEAYDYAPLNEAERVAAVISQTLAVACPQRVTLEKVAATVDDVAAHRRESIGGSSTATRIARLPSRNAASC